MILVTDEVKRKLIRLARAKSFLDQCKREGAHAEATGALRDAREGMNEAVDELYHALPPEIKSGQEW